MKNLWSLLLIAIFSVSIIIPAYADVIWINDFEKAKEMAQQEQKFMLVDFWAWWCGPCKKMDSEVWTTDEVTILSRKFIPVKVDLDSDKATSGKYRVSAIPTMMIMDPFGEVIWQNTGYMNFGQVKELLSSFPETASFVLDDAKKIREDDKDYKAYFNAGLAYQHHSQQVEGTARQSFLMKSDEHFSNAGKYAGKSDNAIYEERAELMEMVNNAYRGKGDKELSKFKKKTGIETIMPENKAAAYYALSVCAREAGKKKDATKYLQALSTDPSAEEWMRLLEDGEVRP